MSATDDYEEYEKQCKLVQAQNQQLLNEFEAWLAKDKLSKKTIDNHCSNIDFYINEYLLYYEVQIPAQGVNEIGSFLGDWFIRKTMWASASSIKSNAASFKKFYSFLHERGEISLEALQGLHDNIKENLPEWLATLKRYEDPSVDIEDVWEY